MTSSWSSDGERRIQEPPEATITPEPEGQRLVEMFVTYAAQAIDRKLATGGPLVVALRERGAQLAQVISCEMGELRDRIAELEQQLDHARAQASAAEMALEDAGARHAASRGTDLQLLRSFAQKLLDLTDPT